MVLRGCGLTNIRCTYNGWTSFRCGLSISIQSMTFHVPDWNITLHDEMRSVKTIFENWTLYTGTEDMDSNRTWVVQGYERLEKTP